MNAIYEKAILAADEVRMQIGASIYEPVNIFDICDELGLNVLFVDISMEGLYVKQEGGSKNAILISCQRPFPRRVFTCAHELGHHSFSHGLKIDILEKSPDPTEKRDIDEYLVDLFAGSLLMPIAGLQAEAAIRNLSWRRITPLSLYKLCSVFGTGYTTLITHARANNLIDDVTAASLDKYGPAKILSDIFGSDTKKAYFKIIDEHAQLKVIDLEVGNYLVLPQHIEIEGDHLQKFKNTAVGVGYTAVKPGIVRAASRDGNFATFIRIQRYRYAGLAKYRHLETPVEEIS
ncbi:ImmA/IrrE family metallo-endopeptidase [Mucilaginibacter sp. SP1R1]|uniref:ImmA/IrrE family metallo-endopeptidase n=1 Tax=Mucilaginibacter sp. SP1R1 TaxID=2723091 RepID=UPI00160A19BB|nr:ImmA/IrrE family metallo-endopeptidase [Mucilaginibacter sp. SP1R1]MBB6149597.1 hypothetical protein [Mucilaginibacter sp. SP1R1]